MSYKKERDAIIIPPEGLHFHTFKRPGHVLSIGTRITGDGPIRPTARLRESLTNQVHKQRKIKLEDL